MAYNEFAYFYDEFNGKPTTMPSMPISTRS